MDNLGNTLGKHLAKGVRIVCIIAHNIAVAVGIKIFYRKALHMAEHRGTDILQNVLGNFRHGAVIEKGGKNSGEIKHSHSENCGDKGGKIRILNADKGSYIIIDKGFYEKRRSYACGG